MGTETEVETFGSSDADRSLSKLPKTDDSRVFFGCVILYHGDIMVILCLLYNHMVILWWPHEDINPYGSKHLLRRYKTPHKSYPSQTS